MDRYEKDLSLHDRVIEEIKDVLNQEDYDIYTNPGSEKNAGIADNYPDVIMTLKGETTVRYILEVETAISVTVTECLSQWKKYSSEIEATFYIVVPKSHLKVAQELCKSQGINARFATYVIESADNTIEFVFN